jgi:tRNA U34 2-thiouridine synthase MnmA/TrmU
VREIAAEMELVTAEKKRFSSYVFYWKSSFTKFYSKITTKDGVIIQIDKMTSSTMFQVPQD